MDALNKIMEQSIEQIISDDDDDKVVEVDPVAPDPEQPAPSVISASPPSVCGNLNYLDLSNEAAVLEIVDGAVSKALLYPKVGFWNDDDDTRSVESNPLCIDESSHQENENSSNSPKFPKSEIPVIQHAEVSSVEEPDDQFLLDLIASDAQTSVSEIKANVINELVFTGPMAPPIDLMLNGTISSNVQGPIPDFIEFNEWALSDDENSQGSRNVDVSICFSYSNFDDPLMRQDGDKEVRKTTQICELIQNPSISELNPNQTTPRNNATTSFTYNFVCMQSPHFQDAANLRACAVINNNIMTKYNYPFERFRLSSRKIEVVDEIISKYIKDCFGAPEYLFRESRCMQYGPSRNFLDISMHVNPAHLQMRNFGEPILFYHFESNTVVLQFPYPIESLDAPWPKRIGKNSHRYNATFPKNLDMQIEKRHEVARKLIASIFELEKKNIFGQNRNSGRGERRMSRMLGQPINLRYCFATGELSANTTIPFEANHCIEEVYEEALEDIGLDITIKKIDSDNEENDAVPSTSGQSKRKNLLGDSDDEDENSTSTPMDEQAYQSVVIKDVAEDAGDNNDDADSDDETE